MSVLILSKKDEGEYENRRLVTSLSDLSIPATIYHPDKFDVIVGKGTGYGIKYDGQEFDMPDLVLTRTGSGTTEFITALARQFEEEHIRCINSSLSVEIAKDKMRSHQLLASHGLPIPNTMLVRFPVIYDLSENTSSSLDDLDFASPRSDFSKRVLITCTALILTPLAIPISVDLLFSSSLQGTNVGLLQSAWGVLCLIIFVTLIVSISRSPKKGRSIVSSNA